jgi:Sec-independent protein secretion pathway component TatC
LQTTVTPIPTSSAEQITPENTGTRTSPPLSLTLILLAIGCALLLVIGVLVLGFLVRRQNTKGRDNVK